MDRNELIRTAHESAVAWARKLLARNPKHLDHPGYRNDRTR